MARKLLLLALLLVINVTSFVSCNFTCHEVDPNRYCIAYTELSLKTLNIWGPVELNSGDSVYYKDFSIELSITEDKRTCSKVKPSLFGNTAFASCSIINEHYIEDSIVSVEVYSNVDFDKQHKAGTDLSKYFTELDFAEINSLDNIYMHHLNLQRAPSDVLVHTFTVRLIKKSGAAISASTVPIRVSKEN